MVVARVYRVPTAIEKDFGPGAEIHGVGINRNADVAEIAGAIPRGNVHAPAERYGGMREVAAYANAFVHGIARGAGWARIWILKRIFACTKSQIACARWRPPNIIPKFDQAKSASLSLSQYLLWSRNRSTSSGRSAVGVISMSGGVSSGWPESWMTKRLEKCDEPRRNLDPCNAIAEMIDVGAHREVGIAVNLVRREQVRITRWMYAELKEHRRLSRAFESYVSPRFNEHRRFSHRRIKMRGRTSASRANLGARSSHERKRMR
jgi:hypothetical protein